MPRSTRIWVTNGNWAFMESYMLANIGTMVSSITITKIKAMPNTTTG